MRHALAHRAGSGTGRTSGPWWRSRPRTAPCRSRSAVRDDGPDTGRHLLVEPITFRVDRGERIVLGKGETGLLDQRDVAADRGRFGDHALERLVGDEVHDAGRGTDDEGGDEDEHPEPDR